MRMDPLVDSRASFANDPINSSLFHNFHYNRPNSNVLMSGDRLHDEIHWLEIVWSSVAIESDFSRIQVT